MSRSRKAFEAAMVRRFDSLETLFRAFERDKATGMYLRDQVQLMWQGWELREKTPEPTGDGSG